MAQIYLVHLFGKNDATNPATNVTLRLSSGKYHRSNFDYRARIIALDLVYDMEASLWGTRPSTASITAINIDGGLDSFRQYRMISGEIRKGDSVNAFSNANFPVIWSGPLNEYTNAGETVDVVMANRVGYLNTLISAGNIESSVYDGTGKPGAVLTGYLTFNGATFSTGISSGDLDSSSFTALSSAYDYDLEVLPNSSGSQNFLSLVDGALVGIPAVVTVNPNGQVSCPRFRVPGSTSSHSDFVPSSELSIETIHPAAEIRISYKDTDGDDVQRPTQQSIPTKNRWPSVWRSLRGGTLGLAASSNSARRTAADAIGRSALLLFGRRYDRVSFSTRRDVNNLKLGDVIRIRHPRLGFGSGKGGLLTRIRENLSGLHELESWVLNDNHDPTITTEDSHTLTLPIPAYAYSGTFGETYTFTINLAIPGYLIDGGGTENLTTISFRGMNAIFLTVSLSAGGFVQDVFDFGYIEIDFSNITDADGTEAYTGSATDPNPFDSDSANMKIRNRMVITPGRKDAQSVDRIGQPSLTWTGDETNPYTFQLGGVTSGAREFINATSQASSDNIAGMTVTISASPYPEIPAPGAVDVSYLAIPRSDAGTGVVNRYSTAYFYVSDVDDLNPITAFAYRVTRVSDDTVVAESTDPPNYDFPVYGPTFGTGRAAGSRTGAAQGKIIIAIPVGFVTDAVRNRDYDFEIWPIGPGGDGPVSTYQFRP